MRVQALERGLKDTNRLIRAIHKIKCGVGVGWDWEVAKGEGLSVLCFWV